jgi:hypothetical protein
MKRSSRTIARNARLAAGRLPPNAGGENAPWLL